MTFRCPVEDQRFILTHVAQLESLGVEPDISDAVIEGAAALAEGEVAPLNRSGDIQGSRWDNGRVVTPNGFKEAYEAFVEGGWMSLPGPKEWGGQGLPSVLSAAIMDSLNGANLAFTLCPMLSVGAVEALTAHGSRDLQERYLPKIISGEWPATMNLTEPQAGSDVGALSTRAEANGDGSWRISGTKIYITYGEHDLAENIIHLVLARTTGAPGGTKGISLFLVPKVLPDGAPNDLRCVSIEHKAGIHASPTCVMSYGDNGGATGWLVGEEMAGMRAMFTMMNNARLNVALQGVGIAEAATQRAVAYALERKQGRRGVDVAVIAEHPDVRRMLLRMRALTTAARSLTYYAFAQADHGRKGDREAALRADVLTPLAKAWATDIGCEVASLGIQVHGGMGYIEETGAAQLWRDARIAPIYEGTNGIQAADLVTRKLDLDGGAAFDQLVTEIRDTASHPILLALADAIEVAAATYRQASSDDRLAGSVPFLTMCAVLVAGWLLERQAAVVGASDFMTAKRAAADYFLSVVVAEALGLGAAAEIGAEALYAVPAAALA
ncbi:acyl-CoA dehydrogenase [Sphingomonas sp. HDW15A]|uniref:acyl-CoA dehydrogenase n=1 Tax=Sphingomonas sp. HDW15A TaxID=2714942 RepID=UPI00140E494E|nr:acyl-CoA dehydrogenase [Sphingomonas sp. HDW15A]QIK95692.1 acyl-CoA dehydrogenase [Sphingomonas sp. HDW15A]